MTWKSGNWGKEAKERSKKRLNYFKEYSKTYFLTHKRKYQRKFNGLGSKGELIALSILKGSQLIRNSNFDLLWKGKKIEVKIANFNKRKRWEFNTRRQKNKTDFFLLICIAKDKKYLEKIYFIPDKKFNNLNICIFKKTIKYKKFEIRSGVTIKTS
jgi:hypothetical protein